MARGALVRNGIAVEVFEAASDFDPNYGGEGVAFIPDERVSVGDAWDGNRFTYGLGPDQVTSLQARRALNAAGLRSAVEAAVAAADQDTRDAWEYATVIHRNNAIIADMAARLGLSKDQVDSLFRSAANL